MLTQNDITDFFETQLASWPQVGERFSALDSVLAKSFDIEGFKVTVTHNPDRIRSSAAKVDKTAIAARRCFLCDANRPAEQQHIDWRDYRILVNPFPILPQHFTIIAKQHRPQSVDGAIADMVALSQLMPDFAVFYNGPACGASAPDHFHFQAVRREALPMFAADALPFGVVKLSGDDATQRQVDAVLGRLPRDEQESEPKVNMFCTCIGAKPVITIIPRRRHRPDFYGEDGMLISPASIDLAGVIVAPRLADYERITPLTIASIYSQLCYSQTQVNSFVHDLVTP